MRKLSFAKAGIYVVLLIGFFESFVQFLSRRSLWLDESQLALNIIHRTPQGLLLPLDNNQVAPILFLQIEWLFTQFISGADFALRVLPLLCFWCSLFLFYKILCIFFKNTYLIIFGLTIFAFNTTFIYYSSEVKQYICDVFVSLLLYYILLKSYKKENNRYLFLLIIGAICILLSNVTPIILFTIGAYCTYIHLFGGKLNVKYAITTAFAWCILFLVYYYYFIYDHPTKVYMLTYWTKADGFIPFNNQVFNWFAGRYGGMFFYAFYFGNKIGALISILYGLGIFSLFKLKKFGLAILLLLPVCIHLLLSGFKIYPFESRLYLYFCPFIIVVCCVAMEYINSFFRNKYILIPLNIVLPILLLRIILIHPFPVIQHDDVKNCIKEMNSRISNADKIYATILEAPSLKFYKDIKYLTSNDRVIYGEYTFGGKESAVNIERLNNLKDRIWVISRNDETHEDKFITHYLDSVGYNKIYSFTSTSGTNLSLYNSRAGKRF